MHYHVHKCPSLDLEPAECSPPPSHTRLTCRRFILLLSSLRTYVCYVPLPSRFSSNMLHIFLISACVLHTLPTSTFLKMAVFWVVAPRSLVEVYRRSLLPSSSPWWWVSKDLWNVGRLLPDCTALQTRRQPSSYSPPWEPQILLSLLDLIINNIRPCMKKVKLSRYMPWRHMGGEEV
jgi:hypothetical protein